MYPRCPKYFQDKLTKAGGLNRFGQPNYKIVSSLEATFRAGGIWPADGYEGYREVYEANGSPFPPKKHYWMLMEWVPPEQFGGELAYFYLNTNEVNGYCLLGPYPHKGRYQIAVKLTNNIIDNGVMTIEPLPLNAIIIDRIIPIIKTAKYTSFKRRMEAAEADRIRIEKKMDAQIEAARQDSKRPLLLPSEIDDRVRLLEKQWSNWLKKNPDVKSGIHMGNKL